MDPIGSRPKIDKLPLHFALGSGLRAGQITQAELAHRAGLSVPTVRLLEAGRGNPDSWHAALEQLGLDLAGRNLPGGADLGGRLAMLRRRRGLSQRELAALACVSPPTLVALER